MFDASFAAVGFETSTILFEFALMFPVGLSTRFPEDVAILLVVTVRVPTPKEVIPAISVVAAPSVKVEVPSVVVGFASFALVTFAFAILSVVTALFEICAARIPVDLIATTPSVTVKSSPLKDAIPLFALVASSPVIVRVSPETAVSIPSPPVTTSVSPKSTALVVPVSASIEIVEFVSLPFAMSHANCAFETPPVLIVTAPAVTEKSVVPKDAIPFAVVVASVPEIVIVPAVSSYAVAIPVPAVSEPLI